VDDNMNNKCMHSDKLGSRVADWSDDAPH
jgi:hypothetical protein